MRLEIRRSTHGYWSAYASYRGFGFMAYRPTRGEAILTAITNVYAASMSY